MACYLAYIFETREPGASTCIARIEQWNVYITGVTYTDAIERLSGVTYIECGGAVYAYSWSSKIHTAVPPVIIMVPNMFYWSLVTTVIGR